MTDIQTGPCESDPRGHIIGASGMCQWCHKDRMELEHKWIQGVIASLTGRLAAAEAREQRLLETTDAMLQVTRERLAAAEKLLREADESGDWFDGTFHVELNAHWVDRTKAALEGKQ